ncbi:MAG: ATP-binding protein [Bryobacteraceae bacterium]
MPFRLSRSRFRSLATKFSVFTASLVLWVTSAQLSYHWAQEYFSVPEHMFLSAVLLVLAVLLARVTSQVFVRPLIVLQEGMAAVKKGKLETIRISPTGDEIERLGESFNEMITALAESNQKVREYQEQLEDKIRERTEALEMAMNRANAASRAKSDFLANMSHELRTPMNGILGMLEIVLSSPLSAGQREELTTAKECSLSLLTLVNDILDLSKIEAGKMDLEKIRFAPRTLIADCTKSTMPRAREKGLLLLSEVSPSVPRNLLGDSLRLRQVLINLLGNAVKFTEHGSVKLSLTASQTDSHDRVELHFTVADTGIGIAEDRAQTIFEEFTQADGSITRKYGGTGLGLSITKKIVDMYDGRIWVESQQGMGSVFHVVLDMPVAAPDMAGEASDSEYAAASAEEHKGRILIVEDNIVNQKVVSVLLSKRGFETTVANHGREALDMLECEVFDLVLMDIQMPVLDGLETTKLIRQDPRLRNLPVVGLSAHAMATDRERCIEAGMNDYVPKPVQPALLLATIRRYLSSGRGRESAGLVAEAPPALAGVRNSLAS